jgi:hypothetical protein
MTGTLTRPSAAAPSGGERSVALLVGAAVVVVLVVAAVLVFGVDRPPALEPLGDAAGPPPSAPVAWMAGTSDGNCLSVARPDGSVEELWCDGAHAELRGWTRPGEIDLHTYDEVGEAVRTYDAETGELLSRTSVDVDRGGEYGRQVVWTERRDGALVVHLAADDTELWRTDAADRYDIESSALSADGDWAAMVDTAERLLVVPTDGSTAPRVWAEDVPGWQPPLWEGTERSPWG